MLIATRDITGLNIIAAIIILLREIAVAGLREFLADLRVSVPVSKLAKWKTALQLIALGALIFARPLPEFAFPKLVGLITLWAAAIFTLITGWDYLRVGVKHKLLVICLPCPVFFILPWFSNSLVRSDVRILVNFFVCMCRSRWWQ